MTQTGPKEDIEFLSGSWTRLEVLEAMRQEPRTRRDLKDMTDVSRVTLSRTLTDLEDRGWINKLDGEYHTTVYGKVVASELTQLLKNMEMADSLGSTMEWLPIEEFDFELACLKDAEVTTSDWGDHTAQIRQVAETIPGSDRIIATASGVSRDVQEAVWETTVKDGASFEGVLDSTALEIIRNDQELRQQFQDMVELETTEILRYEGDVDPLPMLMICDDTVILCGHDEDGPPPGTLETTNETVLSWAESYFDSVRDDSTPIDMNVIEI